MQLEKPYRASRSYVQHLNAGPAAVFPLLCPVREVEWVEGWEPGVVITGSGIAEAGCVVKVTPGETVADISIELASDGAEASKALVTYTLTALTAAGRAAVDEFTEEAYEAFMQTWESELNAFLGRDS